MSSEEEKIKSIFDKAAIDALGKQLGKTEGTAHATITATETTIDVLVEFTPSAEALAAYRQAVEKAETDVFKAIAGGDLQQAGNVPFFTPSPTPIPPTAYHNVFPPITSEGIQEAAKRLRRLSLRLKNAPIDYTHEPMPLDMGIRDESHGPARGCDDCEEERNR